MSASGTSRTDARAIDVMRREIASIPDVIPNQVDRLRPALREFAAEIGPGLDEVILSGCGDSHFAGIAVRLAFERAAGVRCRAVEALELARYEVRYVRSRPAPLLVAVSYSGEVGRTIEAAATAHRFGWHTMALTGRPAGRLAATVERPILMEVPTLGFSPGTSTYAAMITALLVLASELALVGGRVAEAEALDDALARVRELARDTLASAESAARGAAEVIAAAPITTFLGAGPSRAAAAFGAAKLFEGPQRYGVAQDLEEWAHEQYFISGPSTPIVVVAPSGASHDRALELLEEMAFIGAQAFLVSDVPPPAGLTAVRHLPIAAGLDEATSGLLTFLPLAMTGLFVAETLGTRSYGFPTVEHEREHYETIHRDTRGEPA
ncbi:MAG TPA: SIS domain-containing protein [Candidatus Limnocylindrales bacterium]|jgi:glucosamine--fructose-6-phosphate aminotransferase (isomerizing)|nr:SIS domain-containing protein [Candidatus Limnocylindrales bacterium]